MDPCDYTLRLWGVIGQWAAALATLVAVGVAVWAACKSNETAKQLLMMKARASLLVKPIVAETTGELSGLLLVNPGPGSILLHGLYHDGKLVDGLDNVQLSPGAPPYTAPFHEFKRLFEQKIGQASFECCFLYTDEVKRRWQQYYRVKTTFPEFVPLHCVQVGES